MHLIDAPPTRPHHDPPPPPSRPRLDPDHEPVRRGPDAVQFGIESDRAVVLDGLTPPLARMVAALDGTRRYEDVLADAVTGGVPSGTARAVLGHLQSAGVLARTPTVAPVPEVLVHGGGRVAVALACLLAASGACRVAVRARGTVTPDDTGTGLAARDVGRSRAAAVADALDRVQGARATGNGGDGGLGAGGPALVVLADGPVPDPQMVRTVERGAHLVVGVRDGFGVVGPLVLPGRTACLRCDELTRSEADPAWRAVVAQLCTRRCPVDAAVAGATAALAAAQALAVLRGDVPAPPALGATLELDVRSGSSTRRALAPHPSCGCRQAGRTDLRAA